MYLLTLVHELVLGAVVPGHLCLEAEYLGPHDGVALGHLPGAGAGPLPRAVPEVMIVMMMIVKMIMMMMLMMMMMMLYLRSTVSLVPSSVMAA